MCIYNIVTYPIKLRQKKTSPSHRHPEFALETATLLPALDLGLPRRIREVRIFTVPSGKRLHNYGKSPFLMGKSTINGHFE